MTLDKDSFTEEDEDNEDIQRARKYFSKLIKKICECIGSDIVYDFYLKELQECVQ